MKKLIIFSFLFWTLVFKPSSTEANYGQYGGETPSYSILVDKMVGMPISTKGGATDYQYVDNLSPTDPRFAPGQEVWFKIKIKNTSSQNLTAVEVTDYVPDYLMPLEGPGKWNPDNRTIVWNAGDFNIDEEKIYYLKMKVYDQSMLPANKGLICVINKASAKKNDVAYDEDSAQLCLEKQVVGVEKQPTAGPELGLGILAMNAVSLIVGLKLRKDAQS